jgi:hypothetical protein
MPPLKSGSTVGFRIQIKQSCFSKLQEFNKNGGCSQGQCKDLSAFLQVPATELDINSFGVGEVALFSYKNGGNLANRWNVEKLGLNFKDQATREAELKKIQDENERKRIAEEKKQKQEQIAQLKEQLSTCRSSQEDIEQTARPALEMLKKLGAMSGRRYLTEQKNLEKDEFELLLASAKDASIDEYQTSKDALLRWNATHRGYSDRVSTALLDIAKTLLNGARGDDESWTLSDSLDAAKELSTDASKVRGISSKQRKVVVQFQKRLPVVGLIAKLQEEGSSPELEREWKRMMYGRSGRAGLYGDLVKACSSREMRSEGYSQECNDAQKLYQLGMSIPDLAKQQLAQEQQRQQQQREAQMRSSNPGSSAPGAFAGGSNPTPGMPGDAFGGFGRTPGFDGAAFDPSAFGSNGMRR